MADNALSLPINFPTFFHKKYYSFFTSQKLFYTYKVYYFFLKITRKNIKIKKLLQMQQLL
ncbi:hypothetical protein CA840_07040 [Fusobacterium polymorphum]|uniref:Uncharacterized protein n=1 Tax=Fusobacterium nucleatum subsp. polymorphum TaxID=76857 RepID=A0A2C6B2V9_FUSNP|nr:hypothetical protein CA840_07040 [Fusobacterium polymorphum]